VTIRTFIKKKVLFGDDLGNQVTSESVFFRRRFITKSLASFGLIGVPFSQIKSKTTQNSDYHRKLDHVKPDEFRQVEDITKYKDATSYNNFYEYGTGKGDPSRLAPSMLRVSPWTLEIDGLVHKKKTVGIDDLASLTNLEERVYRMRCVEGWSMVVPWIGYSLSKLINLVKPLGSAKYVSFTTLADPEMMPGVAALRPILPWPYVEGLRMDEAMNPLTLLTFGFYGKTLLEQNGAPVRLVVPWKYGFKGAKSIVRISFVEKQPQTTWVRAAPSEYGFYSNVNPNVSHPRWSQAKERRIGMGGLFASKIPTRLFNGYESLVGQMYTGMDLKKFY
tara:strand:- start:1839 stop:2837 length:999 start_codon:yes stop_codon:yes gene_type:complete